MLIAAKDLGALVEPVLAGAGLAPRHVPMISDLIVRAERDGSRSHGLVRLPETGIMPLSPRPKRSGEPGPRRKVPGAI